MDSMGFKPFREPRNRRPKPDPKEEKYNGHPTKSSDALGPGMENSGFPTPRALGMSKGPLGPNSTSGSLRRKNTTSQSCREATAVDFKGKRCLEAWWSGSCSCQNHNYGRRRPIESRLQPFSKGLNGRPCPPPPCLQGGGSKPRPAAPTWRAKVILPSSASIILLGSL